MADSTAVEAVKFWGGLAGLVTFAFTLWDRAFRSRPWIEPHVFMTADFRSAVFGGVPDDVTAALRIFNPGPRTIGIGQVRFYPRTSDPLIALIDEVGRDVHPKRLLPVQAEEAKLFDLIWRDLLQGEDPERTIWVIVPWRPLAGILPRFPLVLRTSIAALRRLQDAEIQSARIKVGLPAQ
jgi:hypothetical protein